MTVQVGTLGEAMALVRTEEVGPLETQRSLTLSTGGAEMNVAIGLARLGVSARWLGRVGDDSFGRLVQRDLQAESVQCRLIIDPDRPTGLMVKERRSAAKARVTYFRAQSAGSGLALEDVELLEIPTIGLLHVTGITPVLSETAREAIEVAVEIAVHHGVPVSFDINHRESLMSAQEATPIYQWIAERSTILFGGEEEIRLLTSSATNLEEAARELSRMGPPEVLIKRGAQGCAALVDGTAIDEPAVSVMVADTVGAGDAFVAGYLASRLSGAPGRERVQFACRTGAAACLTAGDWDGAARAGELEWLLEEHDPVSR